MFFSPKGWNMLAQGNAPGKLRYFAVVALKGHYTRETDAEYRGSLAAPQRAWRQARPFFLHIMHNPDMLSAGCALAALSSEVDRVTPMGAMVARGA
jgi:hypothetical protein